MKRGIICLVFILSASLVTGCAGKTEPLDVTQLQPSLSKQAEPFELETIPSPVILDTSKLVKVPDPLSEDNPRYPEQKVKMPPVGSQVNIPDLGTTITRVTVRSNIRHEYSRFDPFNADKSLLMLLDFDEGYFYVLRAEVLYDAPSNLADQLYLGEPCYTTVIRI